MAGLTFTLNTAGQTLLNTQLELQTASNNISNANSPGYSRQTAVQTENPEILTSSGWLGTGASVTYITQARDSFLEQQLMNASTSDSQYTALASQLTSIQAACSDSGQNGISQALGNFFDAWSTLAQNPQDLSGQTSVYSAAQNLAGAVQSTYDQLNQIAGQIPGQISDTVDQANSLIDRIAQLNKAIAQSETSSSQANELRDERYQAMDSLAQLIPVSFSQDPSTGMFTVSTTDAGGSLTLVSGGTGTPISTSSTISGGQLGGLLQAQNSLNGYIGLLNTFASTLISQVNSTYGQNGGPAVFTGTDASSIAASSDFLSGQTSADLSAGAQAMANLQDAQLDFSGGTSATLQEYLSNIQQQIGTGVQQANNSQSFYDSLKSQLQTRQQSVSGVSLDEEMINVIQYQQIYQAAAKVVQTTAGLMNTVINMVQ